MRSLEKRSSQVNDEWLFSLLDALHENKTPTKKIEDSLTDPFSPMLFKKNAVLISSILEQHLYKTSANALDLISPKLLLKKARELMIKKDIKDKTFDEETFKKILFLYIETGIQVQSTKYMGRQFSSVIPLSGLMDFVSSIINQPSSFYEAAQLPKVAEKIMAEEFNKFIGWKQNTFSMITTSGGSLANLTAILTARNKKYPEFWAKGNISKNLIPAIAISEDSHYSINRAAGILGIGEEQIIKLPINEEGKIILSQVEIILDNAKKRGLDIFCLVASAGTTSLGAFDNLEKISEITNKRKIWLHVDGAHGGALILSDKLRSKLKGIDKVDSFIIDAHKTLFVPSLCTLLFYKDKKNSEITFKQEASYVFEKEDDEYTLLDTAEENFECTKRPVIMGLWTTWALYGKSIFSTKLEYLCELTQDAYEILSNNEDFQLIHKPESNILCFRYIPTNFQNTNIGEFQLKIRNKIKEEGKFFISKVDIKKQEALRVVFMNHEINTSHFLQLLEEIRRIGQNLLK